MENETVRKYEHDGEGVLRGWPQRLDLGNGIHVDTRFLLWVANKVHNVCFRWTIDDCLHETYVAACRLAQNIDESKSKATTYLSNYLPSHVIRHYGSVFRQSGTSHQPLGNGVGWEKTMSTVRDRRDMGDDGETAAMEWMPPSYDDESRQCERDLVQELLEHVSDRDRWILVSKANGESLSRQAKRFGVSATTATTWSRDALNRLRAVAEESGITEKTIWGDDE